MRNVQGFALVELMVFVAIIGTLAAVAIPNYQKYQASCGPTGNARCDGIAGWTNSATVGAMCNVGNGTSHFLEQMMAARASHLRRPRPTCRRRV